MTTDLDTRLTAALSDIASTTTTSDDAYSDIMHRATHSPDPKRRRQRALVTTMAVLAGTAAAGVAAAAVVDRLTDDQIATIEQVPTCNVDTESARLAATTTNLGITVDYWIVDGPGVYGDFLFVDGTDIGSGGCGGMNRTDLHPTLPWVQYAFDTPVDGQIRLWFYGQAPADAAEVEIIMNTGSTRAPITSDDGHFVILAELPYNGVDQLERIDAYTSDGTLLASNIEKPAVERNATPED
jgi:hypothetical protein